MKKYIKKSYLSSIQKKLLKIVVNRQLKYKKKLKNKMSYVYKKELKNKYNFSSQYYRRYNSLWKQKINWNYRWKIISQKKIFKYPNKLLKKDKRYIKKLLKQFYLKIYLNNSYYYKNKNKRQFLNTFKKIKTRYLSFRRQKRKKVRWYKIKYKQQFNNDLTLLKYYKINILKKRLKNLNKKKYLKYTRKAKKIAYFIKYKGTKNKKFKFYWTRVRLLKRYWWRKWLYSNRFKKKKIKKKFKNYRIKQIKKNLLKRLLKKFTLKKFIEQKLFIINKHGIKKNNKAIFKQERKQQYLANRQLKNKFNKKKIYLKKRQNYEIFDKIKYKIFWRYHTYKKILNFVIKNKQLFNKLNKIEDLKVFKNQKLYKLNKSKNKTLIILKLYHKNIKLINLKKYNKNNIFYKLNNVNILNKNNILNLLRRNQHNNLINPNLLNLNLVKKIKHINIKKFISNNLLQTKINKYKYKNLLFNMKKTVLKKNKHIYNLQNNINTTNLFNSLILLKQKKQILYLNNFLTTNYFINYKDKVNFNNKHLLLKKVRLLKLIYKIKLIKYIKNKNIINKKIKINLKNLNKVTSIEKFYLIKKIKNLKQQNKKIKRIIKRYKNRMTKKVRWLKKLIKHSFKPRIYNNMLKNKKFKTFIIKKQNLNIKLNNKYGKLSNTLKLYSFNLGKYVDDNNKWINYYMKRSFKWKFFRKRWHYRYTKWKRLLYFKKLMKRAKDSYRKLQKNFIFIKLFRANFNNFMGISEKEVLNQWLKIRRGDNHNENTSIITRFNQMLQLKLDGLTLFLGLAPSRFLAQEFIRCGGLRINGIIITNINHFICINNILQIDLQIKEDLKLFYSNQHWLKVKTRLKYVEFLQIIWPMMMFMLIRWPHNYELFEDSVLTSRWIRFFIRYFPIRISKYNPPKIKWYKY